MAGHFILLDCQLENDHSLYKQYEQLRNDAAIVKVPTATVLQLTGKHVLDLLHRISTNNVKSLDPGHVVTTVLTTDRGRILDVVRLVRREKDALLVGSEGTSSGIAAWLDKYIIMDDVKIKDSTSNHHIYKIAGPNRDCILNEIGNLTSPNENQATLFDTGFLIQSGYDEYIFASDNPESFPSSKYIVSKAAYEIARIESGIPSVNEWNEKFNPLEAGLISWIDFKKGCYIGQEVIARLDSQNKIQKEMIKLKFEKKPEPGSLIFFQEKEIGIVTSSSDFLQEHYAIGIGYLKKDMIKSENQFVTKSENQEIQTQIR